MTPSETPSTETANDDACDGSGREPTGVRAWLKLRRNLLAALIGGAGLGLWQVVETWKIHDVKGFDIPIGPVVAITSALAFVFGQWRLHRQLVVGETSARTVEQLEAARTDLETRLDQTGKTLEELLSDELRLIATKLGHTGQDRVTLYRVEGDTLRCLSRWSAVPALRARGRSTFPASEGAAGIGLKRGAHLANLPDPDLDPGGWYQDQAKMGIPQEVAAGLRMRTRQYIALAVRDRWQERTGVIVIESERPARLRLRDAIALWDGHAGDGIRAAELVRSWETWTKAVGRRP